MGEVDKKGYLMKKMTGGEGWAFIPDEGPKASTASNERSPQPKIRLETRAGKKVTVIAGLHTYGADRLNAIARELKTMCGIVSLLQRNSLLVQLCGRCNTDFSGATHASVDAANDSP